MHSTTGNMLNVTVYVYLFTTLYQFINIDLGSQCIEQVFEVCAVRLSHSPLILPVCQYTDPHQEILIPL